MEEPLPGATVIHILQHVNISPRTIALCPYANHTFPFDHKPDSSPLKLSTSLSMVWALGIKQRLRAHFLKPVHIQLPLT
jgi:hypothetical protein